MPNHVTNILTITGQADEIKACLKTIKGDGNEERHIDFNKIVPRPKSLDITSGGRVDSAMALIKNDTEYFRQMMDYPWVKNEGLKSVSELKEYLRGTITEEEMNEGKLAIENIERYGHKDWYSWSNANWGTKWNAYDQQELELGTIQFDTAWSTPFPVIHELAKKFHNLCFEVKFADEDLGNNCGAYKFEGGQLTGEYLPEKTEALKFACLIKGYEFEGLILDNFGYWPIETIKEFANEIGEMMEGGSTTDLIDALDTESEDFAEKLNFIKEIAVERELYEEAAEIAKLLG